MPPKTHARLAPSAAYRWSHCPGSIHLIESLGLEDEDPTEYTEFGIACHELAEHALKGEVAQFSPEMLEMVNPYLNYIREHQSDPRHTVVIEHRVSLDSYRPSEAIWGTPDAQILTIDYLEIVDLKTGYIDVDPKENEQLVCYAGGMIGELNIGAVGPVPDDFKVKLTIIQPRSGGIKTWETTAGEIRRLVRLVIEAAWDVGPNGKLVAGEHCRFCPAAGHCPELKRSMAVTAQTDFDVEVISGPPSVESVPLTQAANILTQADAFYAWITALKLRVARELAAGRDVPGWKLVAKRPRRIWNRRDDVVAWAQNARLDASDLYEPLTLKSPAQMEKVVGKKNLPEVLYSKVSSGVSLAPSSDRRPAVAVGPAEEFPALQPGAINAELSTTE